MDMHGEECWAADLICIAITAMELTDSEKQSIGMALKCKLAQRNSWA